IKKIEGKFGSQTFNVEANIYTSKENKDKVEIKKKKDEKAVEPVKEPEAQAAPLETTPVTDAVNKEKTEAPVKEEAKENAEEKPKEESKE
ncbi:MAG: hypothetical protein KKB79_00445, partial [Nanoarchaeota archaeon]|nr:hypothetical protein [Nanoarchaeota archaeon]